MKTWVIILATLGLAAGASSTARPCSCIGFSPEEAIARSSDVFLAVVTERVALPETPFRDGLPGLPQVLVRLELVASWKGVRSDTLSVRTIDGSSACGVDFFVGAVYLVYGQRDPEGGLHTSARERGWPARPVRIRSPWVLPPTNAWPGTPGRPTVRPSPVQFTSECRS